MKTETITRKALDELMWSEPIFVLIKRYQTSHPELRKTCLKMKIPNPGQGYWSRKKFGKEDMPEPLPSPYKGPQEVTLTLLEPGAWSRLNADWLDATIEVVDPLLEDISSKGEAI